MNSELWCALLAVIFTFTAGTLLVVQPVWFMRLANRGNSLNEYFGDHSRRREYVRLLREDRREFNRQHFATVLFMRFMGIIWYVGFLIFLLLFLDKLFA